MNATREATAASESGSAELIDGRALAKQVKARTRERALRLQEHSRPARLESVLVGGDEAARLYARNQVRACRELGIDHELHELPAGASYEDIAGRVLLLNADDDVDGIMVHLPLPEEVDTETVQSLIAVGKDVEGVNPANIGNIVYGRRSLVPCTALATIEMIESTGITLPGSLCVVVGASNIVGKPVVVLLMRGEATVVSTNIHTRNLPELARQADVLVSATGVAGLIKPEMVKPGAVVVDVGISRIAEPGGKTRTVGDVQFDAVKEIAGWISPVPGGVGPLTVAMLLRNTVEAAERRRGVSD